MKKILVFFAIFCISTKCFAILGEPAKYQSVSYPTDYEAILEKLQSSLRDNSISTQVRGGQKMWLQAIADRLTTMSGTETSIQKMKGILLSESVVVKKVLASTISNTFWVDGQYKPCKMKAHGSYVWCVVFVGSSGNEYPLIKIEGTYGACLNPVCLKKPFEEEKEEVEEVEEEPVIAAIPRTKIVYKKDTIYVPVCCNSEPEVAGAAIPEVAGAPRVSQQERRVGYVFPVQPGGQSPSVYYGGNQSVQVIRPNVGGPVQGNPGVIRANTGGPSGSGTEGNPGGLRTVVNTGGPGGNGSEGNPGGY